MEWLSDYSSLSRETSVKIATEPSAMATGEDDIEVHIPEPDFDSEDGREDSDIPSPTSALPREDDADVASQPDSESQLVQLKQHYIQSMDSTVVVRQLPSEGISFQLWPAATTLVSLLDRHRSCPSNSPLSTTLPNSFEGSASGGRRCPLRILELGSGTGLVGIAAAAVLGANVTVTDLPHVLPNLQFNADANQKLLEVNGGSVEVAPLAWGNEEHMEAIARRERESDAAVDVIMGSDVVYHDHLYDPLLRTLKFLLLGLGVGVGGCDEKNKWRRVFLMGHLKRWKKESAFFKKARKLFDVKIIHADPPIHGSRVGVVVYRFAPKLLNSE